MAHLALYRKYRSQTFSDLVGQEHVVRTLKNAVASGRIAHSFLFTGPRGTGKTSTARLLAKALNCPNVKEGEPCGTCEICMSITDGSAMDVVEIDAASESGVEDVREKIVEAVEYKPAECQYKVFIIDEVHDLSAKAFDALLKTIEEPPSHIVFVLATTEYNKVPPTVRSRCQKFEFHRGSLEDLKGRLEFVARAEGIEFESAALAAIAKMSDGGYRDALTLLEQAILTATGNITLDHVYSQLGLIADETSDNLIMALVDYDVPAIINLTDEIYRLGRDPGSILAALLLRLSDLTRAVFGLESFEGIDAVTQASQRDTAGRVGKEKLLTLRSDLADLHRAIRETPLPRVWLEAQLIHTAQKLNAPAVQVQAQPVQERREVKIQEPAAQPQPQAQPTRTQTQPEPEQRTQVQPPQRAAASEEDAIWLRIFGELSVISKIAKNRLEGTAVGCVNGNNITIAFERESDVEWIQENAKIRDAIYGLWRKYGNPDAVLIFEKKNDVGSRSPDVSHTLVELPLEGERLVQAAQKIFTSP